MLVFTNFEVTEELKLLEWKRGDARKVLLFHLGIYRRENDQALC